MRGGDFKIFPLLMRRECSFLQEQSLKIPLKGCQWRAKIVGDIGHQFTPQPIRLFELLYLLTDSIRHLVKSRPQLVHFIPPLGSPWLDIRPVRKV